MKRPFQLLPVFRERVWGRDSLDPWFSANSRPGRIGEVWFTFEENPTPEILGTAADPDHPGICPLLVKLLFTTDRLSVQVHPDDNYAAREHGSLGKTEAWYVLDVQPPGEIAVGFREKITRERLRAAAQSGEIERLLDWRKVSVGEVIFVPAGTVHAIGAGLTICEIQENSDITYRLYDYGRPRELHLENGVAVSYLGPHEFAVKSVSLSEGREQLLACPYFRIERLRPKRYVRIAGGLPFFLVLLCVKGSGEIAGRNFRAGDAWMLPAESSGIEINGAESEWIFTYAAEEPATGISAGTRPAGEQLSHGLAR